jgi:hypothetical protein
LRHVFEAVVRAKGEGFAVDARVIEANASRYHGKAPDEIDWLAQQEQETGWSEATVVDRLNLSKKKY